MYYWHLPTPKKSRHHCFRIAEDLSCNKFGVFYLTNVFNMLGFTASRFCVGMGFVAGCTRGYSLTQLIIQKSETTTVSSAMLLMKLSEY